MAGLKWDEKQWTKQISAGSPTEFLRFKLYKMKNKQLKIDSRYTLNDRYKNKDWIIAQVFYILFILNLEQ